MEIIADFCSNWKNIEHYLYMLQECVKYNINYVKLQLFRPGQVPKAYIPYALSKKQAKTMFDLATDLGLVCFFTPCFEEAIGWCEEFGVSMYKVRFADNKNDRLMELIHNTKKPVVISTNEFIITYPHWDRLYCVSRYPALKTAYDRQYPPNWKGISDHTTDLDLYKYIKKAYPNMKWFEKHVYLDDVFGYLEKKWSVSIKDLGEALLSS